MDGDVVADVERGDGAEVEAAAPVLMMVCSGIGFVAYGAVGGVDGGADTDAEQTVAFFS